MILHGMLFATATYSAMQHCNIGTMISPFETMSKQCCNNVATMLQRCVAIKNRRCESFRVTSPEHFVLSLLYFGVKAQLYFVNSSCMSLDKKTLLKIWLNSELNLTIFQEKK